MKRTTPLFFVLIILACQSCDESQNVTPVTNIPDLTVAIKDKAVIKVMPIIGGWISLYEMLQSQYLITEPNRELVWLNTEFQEVSTYQPPAGWSLIDAVVHPSGQVSAAIINLDFNRTNLFEVKMLRLKNGAVISELALHPLILEKESAKYFPASLDRIKLEVINEDVYIVVRWDYNQVEAIRLGFFNNTFLHKWQTLVEPAAFAGAIGIIGGGFDNFKQGDRYFLVYSGIDNQGNLYVGVPSHEDLLHNHDFYFHETLVTGADPASYDWGIVILTKYSPSGSRIYSKLEGKSTSKRIINMRVGEGSVFFFGRVKVNSEPGGWDAWILSVDDLNGNLKYESQIDIQDGDMIWDINPIHDGGILAVGAKAYTQNPAGLSVSDMRLATAFVVNMQGVLTREIELPQGPPQRGSEAMFVRFVGSHNVMFAGVHNAPGTHASVYCDGFIAVRDFSE